MLNSVRQHNHFITQGNYKATCFDYCSVIFRPILSIESQDAMHTLGSHRVYTHGIHQTKKKSNLWFNFHHYTLFHNTSYTTVLWQRSLPLEVSGQLYICTVLKAGILCGNRSGTVVKVLRY